MLKYFFRHTLKQLKRVRSEANLTNPSTLPHFKCTTQLSRFVSAEGCYSCVVVASSIAASLDLRVKITPLLLSDHSNAPVWWFRGSLIRCLPRLNSNIELCGEVVKAWHAHRNGVGRLLSAMPIDAAYRQANVVRDCFDMRWICRSAPGAALHALPGDLKPGQPASLRVTDAVQLHAREYEPLPEATLIATPSTYTRNDTEIVESPAFHFRKWIDRGRWRSVPFGSRTCRSPLSFVIGESGFRIHKCAPI